MTTELWVSFNRKTVTGDQLPYRFIRSRAAATEACLSQAQGLITKVALLHWPNAC